MRLLRLVIAVPLALLLIVFCVVNRHQTSIDLWPLPYVMDLPLFVLPLGGLLLGVLFGGVAAWLARLGGRRKPVAKTETRPVVLSEVPPNRVALPSR